MSGMFWNSAATTLDLSNFDTSNVTDMSFMFRNSEVIKIKGLDKFNTSKVCRMEGMFYNCTSLTSIDLSSFNTSKVTSYSEVFISTNYGMFTNCKNLTTTINIMNANAVYDGMFLGAATEGDAKIIVNYTSETESLVDNMIATKSANSNVVKGVQK